MNTVDISGTVIAVNKQPKFVEVELRLPKEKKAGGFAETKVKFVGDGAMQWAAGLQDHHVILLHDVSIEGFRGEKGLYVSLTSFRPGQFIWTGQA